MKMAMIPKMITFIKLMIIFNLFISILFPILKLNLHPLTYIIILIFYILNLLLLINLELNMNIYMYMIFISMIGGLMIMFMYFTSLINNFKMIMFKYELYLILFTFIMMMICMIYSFMNYNPINYLDKITFKGPDNSIILIYMYPYYTFTFISITYLIYCLNLIMKMSLIKFKSLRKIKN
uniref:NADH dehydrogenase subunit 6 n=1 Tax=Colletes gigas TaxID=935657 RepID=A0A7D5PX27_9HYME|nr:NADH dehydrogenase subunit 6 [Colletes gigas]